MIIHFVGLLLERRVHCANKEEIFFATRVEAKQDNDVFRNIQ